MILNYKYGVPFNGMYSVESVEHEIMDQAAKELADIIVKKCSKVTYSTDSRLGFKYINVTVDSSLLDKPETDEVQQ